MHVKSKNPRNYAFELDSKLGDSFELGIRKIMMDAKVDTVIGENEGDLIKVVDLMPDTEGEYQYLSGAEMDDMRTIVLPVGTIVALTADMDIHNGMTDEHGDAETDFISASTVVRIEP